MGICYICNHIVSGDCEQICVKRVREKYFPICKKCASVIKAIDSDDYSNEEVNSRLQLLRNSVCINKAAERYIEKKLKNRELRITENKKKKTMYVFEGRPLFVPKTCTNCLKPTDKTETIINIEKRISRYFSKKKISYKIEKFKFGLCDECRKNGKGLSILPYGSDNGGSLCGIMCRNRDYAKLLAYLNKSQFYDLKCPETVDCKFSQIAEWIRYFFVKLKWTLLLLFWIGIILIFLNTI